MKVFGLDNKEYSWNITKYRRTDRPCSNLHVRARFLLNQMFPFDVVYEELVLPGTKTERIVRPLVADFYIHANRLMIEVQGQQHYKFNGLFYHNKAEYFRAQHRDYMKLQWCVRNGITLVALPFDESDEEWKSRIRDI